MRLLSTLQLRRFSGIYTTCARFSTFTNVTPIYLLILTLILSVELPGQDDRLDGLDEYIEKALDDWQVPGLAIGIVSGDSVIYLKGYGVRKAGTNEPVDEHTIFAVASNTKAFTACAIAILHSESKLSLDNPVTEYLPWFKLADSTATKKLTVRDLLCHRAGLATYGGDLTWYGSIYDRTDALQRVRFQQPAYDIRTGYGYSNLMFLAAGEIIPVVEKGISWDQFIEERFFKPLGMNRSSTTTKTLGDMKNVAAPHMIRNNHVLSVPYVNVDNAGPAASINSTVSDMSRWLQLQLNNGTWNGKQLIPADAIEETRKPHNYRAVSKMSKTINPHTHFWCYGLGWVLSDYRGYFFVNHTGGLDGMFSASGFLPEADLGVVVLTNLEDHRLMVALRYEIMDRMLGVESEDWSAKFYQHSNAHSNGDNDSTPDGSSVLPLPLENYAGTYRSELYGTGTIFRKEEQLRIKLNAHPDIIGKIEHVSDHEYLIRWNNPVWMSSKLVLEISESGVVNGFQTSVRPDWIDTLTYSFVKQ